MSSVSVTQSAAARLQVGHLIPLLIVGAAAAPIATLFLAGVQFFAIASEFVGYRISDALSIMVGEAERVRPVQGLPTALLSKYLTIGLYSIFGRALATGPIIQVYCALYFAVIFAAVAACANFAWKHIAGPQQIGFALLALAPFYLGGADMGLMLAPDYWVGEWAYLLTSIGALALVADRQRASVQVEIALGAWAAIGAAIKITLAPIALLLWLAYPFKGRRAVLVMALSGAMTYILLALLYFDFAAGQTIELLRFQLAFFLRPNESAQFAGLGDALAANPLAFLACGIATIMALASARSRPLLALAAAVWIAALVWLVAQRPHGTSLTSATLVSLFLAAVLASRIVWPVAATAVVLTGAYYSDFPALRGLAYTLRQRPAFAAPPPGALATADIVYVPTNDWVAGLPIQVFGYNGQLGGGELAIDGRGRLTYSRGGGAAFRLLFPHQTMAWAAHDAADLLDRAVRGGATVAWTRSSSTTTEVHYSKVIADICGAPAIVCTERPIIHGGRQWLYGTAAQQRQ